MGAVVDGISEDQLGNTTPCTEWSVRDIVNHVTAGATMFTECVEHGAIPDERLGQLMGGDNLGDDFKGAFHTAADKAAATFDQPGVLEKIVKLPFGEMPAGVALNIAVFDLTTHAADLAKATGQTIEDTDLLETAITYGQQFGAQLRQPGVLAEEQMAADGATAADRLLAFAGRQV
jgi:uncharacterized protein (TIGR03086 family)